MFTDVNYVVDTSIKRNIIRPYREKIDIGIIERLGNKAARKFTISYVRSLKQDLMTRQRRQRQQLWPPF